MYTRVSIMKMKACSTTIRMWNSAQTDDDASSQSNEANVSHDDSFLSKDLKNSKNEKTRNENLRGELWGASCCAAAGEGIPGAAVIYTIYLHCLLLLNFPSDS